MYIIEINRYISHNCVTAYTVYIMSTEQLSGCPPEGTCKPNNKHTAYNGYSVRLD